MIRRFLLLLTVLAILPSPRPVEAQDATYVAQVRQALDAVETAIASGGSTRSRATAQALETLQGVRTAPGGTRPYLAHVEGALSRTPPELPLARDHLVALLAELEGARFQPATTEQQRALQQAYADPRFARNDAPSWLERTLDRVWNWLRRLFDGLPIGEPGTQGLTIARWLLVLLCIGLVGLVLALILRSARRISRGDNTNATGPAPASSTSMLAVAAERASAGDYRGAVRAQFVALLLTLHEQGTLRYDRSLTNREHLSRIGQNTSLAGALRPIVRVFDDVWYGNVPIGQSEYDDYAHRTGTLRGGAR